MSIEDHYEWEIVDPSISPCPDHMVHIRVKPLYGHPYRGHWEDLQEIKNLVVGEESEAVELYPVESRKVTGAPVYHLWANKHGHKFPFGFPHSWVHRPKEKD